MIDAFVIFIVLLIHFALFNHRAFRLEAKFEKLRADVAGLSWRIDALGAPPGAAVRHASGEERAVRLN